MSMQVCILRWSGAPNSESLENALLERGLEVESSSKEADFKAPSSMLNRDADKQRCVILMPVSGARNNAIDPENIGDVLSGTFDTIKQIADCFEQSGRAARFILMLPGALAMGARGNINGAAITGALLSLARTLALELKKVGGTVNTIFYEEVGDARHGLSMAWPEDLAEAVASLSVRNSGGINGQELFVLSAADVGRLHP